MKDLCQSPNQFSTAILLVIFNRPYTTSKVFETIKRIKPKKLYIAGDGPRENFKNDFVKVNEAREIATNVDWKCDVKTLFSKKNLGCKAGVSKGISWFFEHEEYGIILEDDCVPHKDFFLFCENLLNYYLNDNKVFSITGNNFQNEITRGEASYYFSKILHCWGWATWRRAWKFYDGELGFWPKFKVSDEWKKIFPDAVERKYWEKIFELVHKNKINSWAYPWVASQLYRRGFTATPNVNLVSNIGFGNDATHTKSKNNEHDNLPSKDLGEINHPKIIEIDHDADFYDFELTFGGRNLRFPRSWLIFPRRVFYFVLRKISQMIKLIFKF
jgi:hypothetical protein